MMIMDLPVLPLGKARPARRRRFPFDLAIHASRGRSTSFLPAGAIASVKREPAVAVSNAPLSALAGESLARRFHAWSGHSGRRYICSVFPVETAEPQAGLPGFAEAIVIAVGLAADGLRYPIAFCDHGQASGDDLDSRRNFLVAVSAHSVCEWHVHLLATQREYRRSVLLDLEAAWAGTIVGGEADCQGGMGKSCNRAWAEAPY